MKNTFIKGYLTILVLVGTLSTGLAQTNLQQELTMLAQTPPERFHAAITDYLASHTNHVDVPAAAALGWQEGLVALMINSRLEHPSQFRYFDNPSFDLNRALTYRYNFVFASNTPDPGSVFERLWKGGKLSPSDVKLSTSTNGLGALPERSIWAVYDEAIRYQVRLSPAAPKSLLSDILQSGAPDVLRALAGDGLTEYSDAATGQILLGAITNTNTPDRARSAILFGMAIHKPSYSWSVLQEAMNSWRFQTDDSLTEAGLSICGALSDVGAGALLRTVLADTNATLSKRKIALLSINKSDADAFQIVSGQLLDTNAAPELRRDAAMSLSSFSAEQVTNLLQQIDFHSLDIQTQKDVLESAAYIPNAGTNALRYILSFTNRLDLVPEVRWTAKESVRGASLNQIQ